MEIMMKNVSFRRNVDTESVLRHELYFSNFSTLKYIIMRIHFVY